jgi:hypothetical protein
MIGVQAILSVLLGVIVSAFALAALITVAIRERSSWRSRPKFQRILEVVGLLIILRFLIFTSERVFRQYESHRELRMLRQENVANIRVGDSVVTDKQQLAEIVQSLNGEDWFSSLHGGWAKEMDLVVALTSGRKRTYRVASYLKEEGAVIIFEPGGSGYAFSRALPSVLFRARVPLPPK